MKRKKGIVKILIAMAVLIVVAMACTYTPVAEVVGKAVNKPTEWVKSTASKVVGVALGAFLVTWGIGALSIPILGGAMIVIGLVLLAWSLLPLFRQTPSTGTGAGLNLNKPM